MKYKALLLSLAFYGAGTAQAQNEFCNTRNTAFSEGEKLYFKVWYNMGRIWVGAGALTFGVNGGTLGGRKVYHIIGDGKTLKSYEWFYKVRDRYESWVDATTMQPAKFVRNVDEGGFKIYNNVVFNQNIGQ